MASDVDNVCSSDPNFAAICSFIDQFGDALGIGYISFEAIQNFLRNSSEDGNLKVILIKLLRRVGQRCENEDKLQKSLVKFLQKHNQVDAWEVERFGFTHAEMATKIRALKLLLEAQFDKNNKFKEKVNERSSLELRLRPIGRDRNGMSYWYLLDNEANLLVYREEQDSEDKEGFTLVCSNRDDLMGLIVNLQDGGGDQISLKSEDSQSVTSYGDEKGMDAKANESGLPILKEENEPPQASCPEVDSKLIKTELKTELKEEGKTLKSESDYKPSFKDKEQTVSELTNGEHDEGSKGKDLGDSKSPSSSNIREDAAARSHFTETTVRETEKTETSVVPSLKDENVSEETSNRPDNNTQLSEKKASDTVAELAGDSDTETHSIQSCDQPSTPNCQTTTPAAKPTPSTGSSSRPEEERPDKCERSLKRGEEVETEDEIPAKSRRRSDGSCTPNIVVTDASNREKLLLETPDVQESVKNAELRTDGGGTSEKIEEDQRETTSAEDDKETLPPETTVDPESQKNIESPPISTEDKFDEKIDGEDIETAQTGGDAASGQSTTDGEVVKADKPGEEDKLTVTDEEKKANVGLDEKEIETNKEQHGESEEIERKSENDDDAKSNTDNDDDAKSNTDNDDDAKSNTDTADVVADEDETREVEEEATETDNTPKKGKRKREKLEIPVEHLRRSTRAQKKRKILYEEIENIPPLKASRKNKHQSSVSKSGGKKQRSDRGDRAAGSSSESDTPLSEALSKRAREKTAKCRKLAEEASKKKSKRRKAESDEDFSVKGKKRSRKRHKSSGSSSSDIPEEEYESEELLFGVVSSDADRFAEEDSEPESDTSKVKKGRNALRQEERKEKTVPYDEDKPCRLCQKHEHPEWILLCDTCDEGYHTTCLRPPLMLVPDGDWFCPPCEHKVLIETLSSRLKLLDQELKKREHLVIRKERLAFVNVNLDNILKEGGREEVIVHSKHKKKKKKKQRRRSPSPFQRRSRRIRDRYMSDESGEESYEEELMYTRSTRRRKEINYHFDDYDQLIDEAIGEEVRAVQSAPRPGPKPGRSRGKDMANIEGMEEIEDERPPGVMVGRGRRKGRRLTCLDVDEGSNDGDSEEYKASDDSVSHVESEEDSDSGSASGDDVVRRVRESSGRKTKGRGRFASYRADGFVVDSDADSDDYRPTRRSARIRVDYRDHDSDTSDEITKKLAPNKEKSKPKRRKSDSDFRATDASSDTVVGEASDNSKDAKSDNEESEEISPRTKRQKYEEDSDFSGHVPSKMKKVYKHKAKLYKKVTQKGHNKKKKLSDSSDDGSESEGTDKKRKKKKVPTATLR